MSRNQKNNLQVHLEIDEQLVSRFARLFSKGVTIQARTGCSLKEFICGQLGVAEDYLEKRIQTIFLNGKAIDNYETPLIGDGDSLALSAAMPGLVGAVFRRDGYYAAFRKTVTYRDNGSGACALDGAVTVKLFNLTIKEMGPGMLKRGVAVDGSDLQHLLREFADDFRRGCTHIAFDGRHITFDDLLEKIPPNRNIHLSIDTSPS